MITIRSMILKGVQKHYIVTVFTYGSLFEVLRLIYVVVY